MFYKMKRLVAIANELDNLKLYKDADYIDSLLLKLSQAGFREIQPKGDPYTYRQFTDGTVKAIRGPDGPMNKVVKPSPEWLEQVNKEFGLMPQIPSLKPTTRGPLKPTPTPAAQKFREIQPKGDPYIYRQFADGTIKAIKGPEGPMNKTVKPSPQWLAQVNKEFGPMLKTPSAKAPTTPAKSQEDSSSWLPSMPTKEYGMEKARELGLLPSTEPTPKFRETYKEDVGLRDEDSFGNRNMGELSITAILGSISLIFRGIAAAWRGSWPMRFFWEFMALRESPLEVTDSSMQEAAYYVCLAAKRRGSKGVNYGDYETGQKLDPNRTTVVPTFQKGDSMGSVFSSDPYKALSACFGKGGIRGDENSGFTLVDSFNFNLDRDPTTIEQAEDYVANMENFQKLYKRLTGDRVGEGKVGAIEEILVMYEHTMRYAGFPTFIRAPKPSGKPTDKVTEFATGLKEKLLG